MAKRLPKPSNQPSESAGAHKFRDRHCHPLFAAREANSVDISNCSSIDEIVTFLREHLKIHPSTSWLDAAPFDRNISKAFLASTLDEVSEEIVITLHSSDHHALWVNSAALAVAGLSDGIPYLNDGEIVVDDSGRATGLLLEWSAMKLVLDHQPAPSLNQDLRNLQFAQETLRAAGVVSVTDAWIDPGMGEVYLAAHQSGMLEIDVELWVRVSPQERVEQLEYLASLHRKLAKLGTSSRLTLAGVKVFLDGVLSSQTAALLEPYCDQSNGSLIWSNADLHDLMNELAVVSPRLRPHFHALGDGAVRQALDVIEASRHAGLWQGTYRPVVAHAELVSPEDAPRFSALDAEVVISPQWLNEDAERLAVKASLGSKRYEQLGDFAPLLEANAPISYGSDWPVSKPDPLEAFDGAVRHLEKQGYSRQRAETAALKLVTGVFLN